MMTIRTKDAFFQLEKLVQTPAQRKALAELKTSVTLELDAAEKHAASQARSYSTNQSFVQSVAGRRVLARAMRVDPVATELDLIEAGLRDHAAMVGADHAAETHRRSAQASLQGIGADPGG